MGSRGVRAEWGLAIVRKPAGAFLMNAMAFAALAASTTCSSVASGQPYAMLSRMLPCRHTFKSVNPDVLPVYYIMAPLFWHVRRSFSHRARHVTESSPQTTQLHPLHRRVVVQERGWSVAGNMHACLTVNRAGSWLTRAICWRSHPRLSSRTSTPSIRTCTVKGPVRKWKRSCAAHMLRCATSMVSGRSWGRLTCPESGS